MRTFLCSVVLSAALAGALHPDAALADGALPNLLSEADEAALAQFDTRREIAISEIKKAIKEQGLTGVVVAACSPRLHGPTWQELLRRSGLNPAVVEVANIREQCSWVHLHKKDLGTNKALELIQMAIAKAELLQQI